MNNICRFGKGLVPVWCCLALLLGVAVAYGAADPDGLVAAYDFRDAADGWVRDYGPNINPGFLHSLTGNPKDALAVIDDQGTTAFRGDGNGNFFTIPDHPALRDSTAFTVEMQVVIDQFPKEGANALMAFESTRARLWVNADGTIHLDSTPAAKPDYFLSPRVSVPTGELLHIYAFIAGDEIGIAVNGKVYSNHSYRGTLRRSPGDISIGAHPYRGNRYFTGTIRRVCFYNRRLTSQEMAGEMPASNRPGALPKSGVFLPGEEAAFCYMEGKTPAITPVGGEKEWRWQLSNGSVVRRTIRRQDEGTRRNVLTELKNSGRFPQEYCRQLEEYLRLRFYGRFDELLTLLQGLEGELFAYGGKLNKMAAEMIDEELLSGRKTGLPPIMTTMPPHNRPAMRKMLVEQARGLYARNILLELTNRHPRIPDEELLDYLLAAGMKVSTIGSLITEQTKGEWRKLHPDMKEMGYCFSDGVAKAKAPLELSVKDPHASFHYSPAEHWQVRNESTGEDLEFGKGWSVDSKRYVVTILNPVVGQRYAVYYMSEYSKGMNLTLPNQEQIQFYMRDWRQYCRQYRGKILFHHMDGCYHYFTGRRLKWWEFWGYNGCNANPHAQNAFQEFAGKKFQPSMLFSSLDGPAINYTPDGALRQWMSFNQQLVKGFMKEAAAVANENDIIYQFYWGDKHLGFEPDLGALAATGVKSIARPLADAVDVRSMTSQSGQALTSGRLEWLFAHMVNRRDTFRKILDNWHRNRRGELMCIRDMHYFAEFAPIFAYGDATTVDLYLRMFRRINQEYLLMYKYLHGKEVFKHPINIYVVNEWGRQYSWRPWRDEFLRHLTDVPVEIRWISLGEIAAAGVPADATVLMNFGFQGSAWSGTTGWEDPRVAKNIRAFVENGGGFLGVGAAALYQEKSFLAEVLGFDYVAVHPAGKGFVPVKGESDALQLPLLPKEVQYGLVRSDRNIRAREGLRVIAAPRGDIATTPAAGTVIPRPLICENRFGKGRAVYISGFSKEAAYGDVLKRAIFHCAGMDEALKRLYSTNPSVQSYAYPEAKMVILNNDSVVEQETTLTLDVSILGVAATAQVELFDLVEEKPLGKWSASQLAQGVKIKVAPRIARYFLLRQ